MADVRALVPAVVEAATRAPSVHNTQPWRFVAHDDVVELWDDPGRGLPVLDPVGRARLISCGAALALAEVAAAGLGVSTRTTLLPDDGTPEHLADLQLGAPHAPDDSQRAAGGQVLGSPVIGQQRGPGADSETGRRHLGERQGRATADQPGPADRVQHRQSAARVVPTARRRRRARRTRHGWVLCTDGARVAASTTAGTSART